MQQRKEKWIAVSMAFFLGFMGGHRFYLYGKKDFWAYWHIVSSLLGIVGITYMIQNNLELNIGWLLMVMGYSSLFVAFLSCIIYGLKPDDVWEQTMNQNRGVTSTGSGTIVMVSLSLLIGMGLMMMILAMSFDRYYTASFEEAMKISQ